MLSAWKSRGYSAGAIASQNHSFVKKDDTAASVVRAVSGGKVWTWKRPAVISRWKEREKENIEECASSVKTCMG